MELSEIKYGIATLFSGASTGLYIYNSQISGPPLLSALGAGGAVCIALVALREAINEQADVRRDQSLQYDRPQPPSL